MSKNDEKTISEANIDALTHMLNNRLGSLGISLSDNDLLELNNTLTQFFSEDLKIEVTTAEPESKLLSIYFDAESVCQKTRMRDQALNENDLVNYPAQMLRTLDGACDTPERYTVVRHVASKTNQ